MADSTLIVLQLKFMSKSIRRSRWQGVARGKGTSVDRINEDGGEVSCVKGNKYQKDQIEGGWKRIFYGHCRSAIQRRDIWENVTAVWRHTICIERSLLRALFNEWKALLYQIGWRGGFRIGQLCGKAEEIMELKEDNAMSREGDKFQFFFVILAFFVNRENVSNTIINSWTEANI